jgi:rhodanese-related sulfurtransferase
VTAAPRGGDGMGFAPLVVMKIMTTQALQQWRDEGIEFTLVDVLSQESFAEKHLPDAINAPVQADDFLDTVAGAVGHDLEKNVVVYCASTTCDASSRAARRLEQAGFVNVFDYEEGIKGWEAAGNPLEGSASVA